MVDRVLRHLSPALKLAEPLPPPGATTVAAPGSETHFVNFAYGSNMSSDRLRSRTPSAIALGKARLPGYRLAWHKIGQDGSAKCDIVETGSATDVVWGVLYRIAAGERAALDLAEGLGRGYDYRSLDVFTADAACVAAGAYVATRIDAALRPHEWYWRHVVDGAAEHDLPLEYRQALQQIRMRCHPAAR